MKNQLKGLSLSPQENLLGWTQGPQQPKVMCGHHQDFRLQYHSFVCIMQTSQTKLRLKQEKLAV